MVVFDKDTYKKKKEEFNREYKRVEPYRTTTSSGEPKEPRRKLTDNLQKRQEYKDSLVKTYNELIDYLNLSFKNPQNTPEEKLDIQQKAVENFSKLKETFVTLNLTYVFDKNIFSLIQLSEIIEDDQSDNNSDSSQNSGKSVIANTTNNKSIPDQNKSSTMVQSKLDFLTACHAGIDYKYDGNPTGLDAFIDAIELLDSAVEPENLNTLLKFIKTRLEGKAREAIITEPTKVEDFITQLKNTIKTESSKVIQGKILALRADKSNLSKFSERADELAEEYRRSLIGEGFSTAKAKELSVERTVELCIKQARHERIKTILSSKVFSEPKDVIAKMIIEINNLKLDGQPPQNVHKNGNQNRFGKNFHNNRFSRPNGQNSNNNFNQNRNSNRPGPSYNGNSRPNYNNNNNNNRNGQNNYSQGQNRTFTNTNYRRANEQPIRMVSGNQTNPGNGGETTSN